MIVFLGGLISEGDVITGSGVKFKVEQNSFLLLEYFAKLFE